MTHDRQTNPPPAAAPHALDLMAAPRDTALADLHRLHLVLLLDTASRCRFSYPRDAVSLTDDRHGRHLHILRSHGYAATTRDATGAGWAYLTAHGARRHDTQIAAHVEMPAAARSQLAMHASGQPDWFTPTRSR